MLNLPFDGKAWKQKKIPLDDFENAVGVIGASVSRLFRILGKKGAEKLTILIDSLRKPSDYQPTNQRQMES